MCTTCGCGSGDTHIEGKPVAAEGESAVAPPPHAHGHADGTVELHAHGVAEGHLEPPPRAFESREHYHRHADGTWHSHVHAGGSAHGAEASYVAAALAVGHGPVVRPARMVQIEQDILAKNDALAAVNRRFLGDHGVFALNLVSSPGSGKTTLLKRPSDSGQNARRSRWSRATSKPRAMPTACARPARQPCRSHR